MNSLSTFTEPLGWALLHFLWQGAAIALLLRAFLWLARRSAPHVRYVASGAALLLMVGTVAGTVWWTWPVEHGANGTDGADRPDGQAAVSRPAMPSPPPAPLDPIPHPESPPSPVSHSPGAPADLPAVSAAAPPAFMERFRAMLPWLVGAWAAGVALCSLRLVNGWRNVRRWRLSGNESIPAEWRARFAVLCEKLRILRPVRLLSSASLAVPVVIGWLKPAVLVPAGLFSGIPAVQLEAILAHELAHVRRCDWLVNLLQTLVETVLFYHPAVWWVSAQLRREREHCCDDIAASVHGDTISYARALTALEELRAVPSPALSAAGGSLLQRIRRLAGLPEERAAGVAWPLGILFVAALAMIVAFSLPEKALAQEEKPPVKDNAGQAVAVPARDDIRVPSSGKVGNPGNDLSGPEPAPQPLIAAPEKSEAANGLRHEQTTALLKRWREEYKDAEELPAEAMHRLAAQVKDYIGRYPGAPAEKLSAHLARLEAKEPWSWESAQTMLDELCDCATAPAGWLELQEQVRSFNRVKPGQQWTAEQLAKLPFGDTDASGLRAAWIFDPMQEFYAAGSVLKCRILFHNNGKEPVEFRTDQWHQEDQWIVKNAASEEVKVKTTWFTGITPWQKVRLAPGEVFEVKAHGVGIGEGKYEESYSTGAIGAEIPAKPGDELTCQWEVQLDNAPRDPNWTPAPGTPPARLTTGKVKFKVTAPDPKVTAPDPNAAPKIGVARSTGKYELAEGIKLQVTQVTSSEDGKGTSRINTATIEWYAGNGEPGLQWPIELTASLSIDPIVWKRGGSALWIVRNGVVRKIDFANAADVKETVFKKGAISDYGAPAEVALEILRFVNAEIARAEEEIRMVLPATKPGDLNQEQLVISVKPDGSIVFKEKTLTLQKLSTQLTEVAKTNRKQAIIIRASADTRYDKIVEILDLTHKAGLFHVSFATAKAVDERSAEPKPDAPAPKATPESGPNSQPEDEKDKPAGGPLYPRKKTIKHPDGTRIEVESDAARSQTTETTIKNGVVIVKRVFLNDAKGRARAGVIYDGKGNLLGSLAYGYDKATDRIMEEQQYNPEGKLVRRLFYPGALNDPKYAGRFVAFTYDPDDPKAQPKEEMKDVFPTRPVSETAPAGGRRVKLWTLTIPGKAEERTEEQQLTLAKELRTKLAGGADFATLAKEHSRDSVQESGGDRGWVNEHSLPPEFRAVVSKLPKGELSEVTPLTGNYYIFRIEDEDFTAAQEPQEETGSKAKAHAPLVEKLVEQGQSLYDLGQYERAKQSVEQALELDSQNKPARDLLDRLQAKEKVEVKKESGPEAEAKRVEVAAPSGISLTVLDAAGKSPLKEFRVIAGVRAGSAGGKDTINWQPHTLRIGKDGGLLWPLDKAYDEMALRVEADGYAPQVFNWIEKKRGAQDLFFQMVKSGTALCQVWTPDQMPAAGAVVALAMVQRDAVIENGKLRHLDAVPSEKASDQWRRARILKANERGEVMIPAETDPTAALLVMHESGVREISLAEFHRQNPQPDINRDGFRTVIQLDQIVLQPWARVSGKVQWGDKPGAGQKVSLTIHRDSYGYPGIIAQYEKTTAAADGSFVFEKVLPGHVQLSCPIAAAAGNAAGFTEINLTGRITHAELKPGDNTVVIGGGGTAIKGRLTGRENWDGVTFHFHPTAPHIGMPGDDEIWKAWSEFQKSPDGALYFRNGLKVNADGTFEVGGVMPGDYQIFFKREGEDKYLASGKFSMKPETVQQEPMDIGEFKAGP